MAASLFERYATQLRLTARSYCEEVFGRTDDDLITDAITDAILAIPETAVSRDPASDKTLDGLWVAVRRRLVEHYRCESDSAEWTEQLDVGRLDAMAARDYARRESDHGGSQDVLTRALEHISPRNRRIVFLRFLHGREPHEIARTMNATPTSVSNALYAARFTLQRAIAQIRGGDRRRNPGDGTCRARV